MGWLRRRGLRVPTLVLTLLFGMVAGIGGYTFWYAEGASYFSSDPRACMNCHVMREHFESWQKSSHHAVAGCVDCHLPHDFVPKYFEKARNGWNHSLAFTLQNYPEPLRIHSRNFASLKDNCRRCHEDLVGDLVDHGAFADGSNDCIRCHRAVGHGPAK